ncbi:MAG: hypothetical protein DSY43_01220 [Gammaproteobacteria bacterium]|nr:MAG: hypothetical protein DSY43_01220 [Gammaproteobacteria bacterium]
MSEQEDQKELTKVYPIKWINSMLENIKNIILLVIAITLVVMAIQGRNSQKIFGSVWVNNFPDHPRKTRVIITDIEHGVEFPVINPTIGKYGILRKALKVTTDGL